MMKQPLLSASSCVLWNPNSHSQSRAPTPCVRFGASADPMVEQSTGAVAASKTAGEQGEQWCRDRTIAKRTPNDPQTVSKIIHQIIRIVLRCPSTIVRLGD